MREPCASPTSRSRFGHQRGTNSSVSGIRLERADPLHVRVEVPRVDEERAALEALGRDRADERRGGRRGDHDHLLAGLDVRADLGDEFRVPLEQLAVHDRGM